MDNITIRKAVSSDVEKIVELRLLGQNHFEESNPLVWRITEEGRKLLKHKVENDLANNNIQMLLAEAKGDIVGYVQGEVTSRNDFMPKTVGQISLAYVAKQFRRKGVGRRLVKGLLGFFDLNDVERVTVRYIIGNKEAEGFWGNLGFEPIIMTSSTHLKKLDSKLTKMRARYL